MASSYAKGETSAFVSDLSFDPGFGTHVLNVGVPIWDDARENIVGAISILLRRDSLFRSDFGSSSRKNRPRDACDD